jgi:hypothetical protein
MKMKTSAAMEASTMMLATVHGSVRLRKGWLARLSLALTVLQTSGSVSKKRLKHLTLCG